MSVGFEYKIYDKRSSDCRYHTELTFSLQDNGSFAIKVDGHENHGRMTISRENMENFIEYATKMTNAIPCKTPLKKRLTKPRRKR